MNGRDDAIMINVILKLIVVILACGVCGMFVGSFVGIACTPGPCPMFSLGYSGVGAILGAGVGACVVLSARSDPRACNRQDPPMPPQC